MLKVGLAVQLFRTFDVDYNIDVISMAAMGAKAHGIDFLCFGEAVLQGFHSLNGNIKKDIKIAVSQDGEEIASIKQIAKKNSIALAFGYIERKDSEIYSSYLVIDKDGEVIHNHRRVSRGWRESDWSNGYKEGAGFASFSLLGREFTVGLCGDFWMDDDRLPSFGENVLWPVYIDADYVDWQNGSAVLEYAKQASKLGKNVFLVNSLLKDPRNSANGRAAHFSKGSVISQVDIDFDGILICEV